MLKKIVINLVMCGIFFSCAFIHDPFRAEKHHPLSISSTPSTPMVSQSIFCELKKGGKITFPCLPDIGDFSERIFYICDKPAKINVVAKFQNKSPSYNTVDLQKSETLTFIENPCGTSQKTEISIELNNDSSADIIYIKKINWQMTKDVYRGEILIENLPSKYFSSEGTKLVYLDD